jgi:hypothetical protein
MLHTEPVHTAAPCCGAGHAFSQLPQWAAEVAVSTHAPLQFRVPLGQESVQCPAEQTLPAAHAVLQSPQWAGSLLRSAHVASHCCRPAPQLTPHAPA